MESPSGSDDDFNAVGECTPGVPVDVAFVGPDSLSDIDDYNDVGASVEPGGVAPVGPSIAL